MDIKQQKQRAKELITKACFYVHNHSNSNNLKILEIVLLAGKMICDMDDEFIELDKLTPDMNKLEELLKGD